jgi:hypothetical protein
MVPIVSRLGIKLSSVDLRQVGVDEEHESHSFANSF